MVWDFFSSLISKIPLESYPIFFSPLPPLFFPRTPPYFTCSCFRKAILQIFLLLQKLKNAAASQRRRHRRAGELQSPSRDTAHPLGLLHSPWELAGSVLQSFPCAGEVPEALIINHLVGKGLQENKELGNCCIL